MLSRTETLRSQLADAMHIALTAIDLIELRRANLAMGSTTVPGLSARSCVRSRVCVLRSRISRRQANRRTSTRLPMTAGRAA